MARAFWEIEHGTQQVMMKQSTTSSARPFPCPKSFRWYHGEYGWQQWHSWQSSFRIFAVVFAEIQGQQKIEQMQSGISSVKPKSPPA
jgi:hypothetical protein